MNKTTYHDYASDAIVLIDLRMHRIYQDAKAGINTAVLGEVQRLRNRLLDHPEIKELRANRTRIADQLWASRITGLRL